jgi:phosphatidylglycerophosphatase A
MLVKSIEFLATLGPIGKKCPAPGTFGSFAGVLAVLLLSWSTQLPLLTIGLLFIPLILVGIPICTEAEKSIGRSDPGEVIWDEFASIPLVYIGLPASISLVNPREMLVWLVVGFIYFRIFDIIKPLGIKRIQHIGKGLGVMIDDVLAAVYASGLLHLTFTFSLSFF